MIKLLSVMASYFMNAKVQTVRFGLDINTLTDIFPECVDSFRSLKGKFHFILDLKVIWRKTYKGFNWYYGDKTFFYNEKSTLYLCGINITYKKVRQLRSIPKGSTFTKHSGTPSPSNRGEDRDLKICHRSPRLKCGDQKWQFYCSSIIGWWWCKCHHFQAFRRPKIKINIYVFVLFRWKFSCILVHYYNTSIITLQDRLFEKYRATR